ncbi:MAG TPA: hypothetical protein VEZ20_13620, partial [Allosphingosinicella sp.]|nr:hypothetical protein [Allosphingosinicella sp.]
GLRYLHLPPGREPPALTCGPFRAAIVSEAEAPQEWRARIAEWLVKSGCLHVVAWGAECETWHDTVDWANLEAFAFGDIPDDSFVMTTWHADEPLSEALWFAGQCAFHPDVELAETIILHVAEAAGKAGMLERYAASQASPPGE